MDIQWDVLFTVKTAVSSKPKNTLNQSKQVETNLQGFEILNDKHKQTYFYFHIF